MAPVEVLVAIGWLTTPHLDRWRRGRTPDLASSLPVGPDRLAAALAILDRWGREGGLEARPVEEQAGTRDRRRLRVLTEAGAVADPELERALTTHWVVADLSAAARRQVERKQQAVPDLTVTIPGPGWCCDECGGGDDHRLEDGDRMLCLTCADLDHLVLLPAGDATLTRRARKASGLAAVVQQWNQRRKRFRRLGILVEPRALEQAEQQCLGDEEARERRRERDRQRRAHQDEQLVAAMTARIGQLFPGCPAERVVAIAEHTAVRGSGRVGRSAAGRALDDRPLELAVRASVRHENTDYDQLLMAGVARDDARRRIADDVDRIVDGWRSA